MADPPKHLAIAITLTIGGVLVTLILFLLPPKSPSTVAFCLALLFLLPLYPIWVWCRTKNHTWPRIPALLVVWAIVAWFGRSVWPPDAPDVRAWFRQGLDHLRGLPWCWLALSGLVATSLVVILQEYKRRRKTREMQRLHSEIERLTREAKQSAETDKANITDLIRVCGIDCISELDTGKLNPYIDFKFALLNLSLFSISIKPVIGEHVKGYVGFQNDGHFRPENLQKRTRMVANEAENIGFRETGYFTLRQFLEPHELEKILKCSKNSEFWFSNLELTIEGEDFDPVLLRMQHHVQKESRWFPYGEAKPTFAFNRASDLAIALRVKDMAETDTALHRVADEFGSVLTGIGESLDAYFAAINNFADSQLEVGKWRIDELTDKIKGAYAAKARLTLDRDSSLTVEQKESVLRELEASAVTESNDGSEKKAAMTQSASKLKEKNQEIRRAYTEIENAWEQISSAIKTGTADRAQAAELAQRLSFLEEETQRFVEKINFSRNTNNA